MQKYPDINHYVEVNKVTNIWQLTTPKIVRSVKQGYDNEQHHLDAYNNMDPDNTLQTHLVGPELRNIADKIVNIHAKNIKTRAYLHVLYNCKTKRTEYYDDAKSVPGQHIIPNALNIDYDDLFRNEIAITKLFNYYDIKQFDVSFVFNLLQMYKIMNDKLITGRFYTHDQFKDNETYTMWIRDFQEANIFFKNEWQERVKTQMKKSQGKME